jgi:GTP diphosphokinase / guanosine-3',5'-bis(diphosphate) 3'-diphosphatase
MIPPIEFTLGLVTQAHAGQQEKDGNPYVWHPIRVALGIRDDGYKGDFEADQHLLRTIALLHDVIEDTHFKTDHLERLGYAEEVLRPLWFLTRTPQQKYEGHIYLCNSCEQARIVKISDLRDHLRPGCVTVLSCAQIKLYTDALRVLLPNQPTLSEMMLNEIHVAKIEKILNEEMIQCPPNVEKG